MLPPFPRYTPPRGPGKVTARQRVSARWRGIDLAPLERAQAMRAQPASAVIERPTAAGFSCTWPLSDAIVLLCQRFCESGHSGFTFTRMSDRSRRTFMFGHPRVSASSGWCRPSAWPATGECDPTTCDALNSWFLNIKTF